MILKIVLNTKEPQMRLQNLIGSKLHDIYTKTVNKKALSAYDDKREYILFHMAIILPKQNWAATQYHKE